MLVAWIAACAVGLSAALSAVAADKRYDYDPLGRLIRYVDEQGRVTQYVYDAAGNILRVFRGDAAQAPPTVTAITPDFTRQGQTRQLRLSGSDLLNAVVRSSDPELSVGFNSASPTELVITVSTRADAAIGPKQLTVTNSLGSTSATLNVRPALTLITVPGLVVVPPDSLAHAVVLRLSDADTAPIVFNVSSNAPGVASVSPSSVTLLPGQTEVQVAVTGFQLGRTLLNVSSPALSAAQTFSVFVAGNSSPRSALVGVYLPSISTAPALTPAPLLGIYSPAAPINAPALVPTPVLGVYSPAQPANVSAAIPSSLVGVSVESTPQGPTSLASSTLGLAFGPTPQRVSPITVTSGNTVTLTVLGFALDTLTSITLNPATGITVTGPIQFSPDGSSASVTISVAAGTAASAREVVVSGASGRIEFSDSRGSVINVIGAP